MENLFWRRFANRSFEERKKILKEPNYYQAKSIDDYITNRSSINYPFYKAKSALSAFPHMPNTAYVLLDNVGVSLHQHNEYVTIAKIFDQKSELDVYWIGSKYCVDADQIWKDNYSLVNKIDLTECSEFDYLLSQSIFKERFKKENELKREAFGNLQLIIPELYPEDAQQAGLKIHDRLGVIVLAHSTIDGLPYMKTFTKKMYPKRGKKDKLPFFNLQPEFASGRI